MKRCKCVLLSAGSLWLASYCVADELSFANAVVDRPEFTLQTGKSGRTTATFDIRGDRLAVIKDQKQIVIHDSATGREMLSIPCEKDVFSTRFTPDGEHIVSTGRGGIQCWSLANGKEVRSLSTAPHMRCDFSPMGGFLAAGQMKGATVWDATTWKEVCQLNSDPRSWYSSVSFHPDARRLATSGHREKAVKVWDLDTGEPVRIFEVERAPIYTALFSPDGRLLAATGPAKVIVWEVETGKELFSLARQNPYAVAFSPDSLQVATAAPDHSLTIRDARTGGEIAIFRGHTKRVTSISFSPDGDRLVSSCQVGTVKVWKIDRK